MCSDQQSSFLSDIALISKQKEFSPLLKKHYAIHSWFRQTRKEKEQDRQDHMCAL